MRLFPGSIKGRLFLWVFLFTSTLLIILGTSVYLEVKKAVFHSVEHTLHAKIQILKGLLHEEHGTIELELAEIVAGEYSVPRSGHYYKVMIDDGVLAASPSLVDEDFDLSSGELQSFDEQMQEKIYTSTGPADEPVMVVQHDFEVFDLPARVYAAQSLEESLDLIKKFRIFLFTIIPLSIFVVAVAGFRIVKKSLSPLKEFSSKIGKISHRTMSERVEEKNLAEEMKGLAGSFNSMLDRLETAFDAEKRLIADASHELKTPLSVIKAQCDVLLQRDRSIEEYTGALHTINATSDAMKRLINDMLSLARLDSGILSASGFKSVSINECIERAIKLTRVFADEKRINISQNPVEDIVMAGDENALTEAFSNIIENAVRYNRDNGSVEISISKSGDQAMIAVTDTGQGIKKDDIDKIFDRFYRADSARSSEGTGLGLSIAKAIIEAHGGKINVKSEPVKGASFFISFPSTSFPSFTKGG